MYPRDLPVLSPAAPVSLAMPMTSQDDAAPGLSLHQLIGILWAYRSISLIIAGAVILLAALACTLWPRTYEATATLMVDFEVNDPLAGREFPVGLLGSYMATQVELARGSEVLLPVITRLKLLADRNYTAGFRGEPASLPDWVETRVRRQLKVEQGNYGSQLIYVSYAARSPQEAALVANGVAEAYSDQQHRRMTGPASDRARRYTEQLAELKAKVTRAQEQVSGFRQRTGLVDSTAKIDIDMQLLYTLEQRLLETQNLRRAAEARGPGDPDTGSSVLASTMIQSLKTQLALQNARIAELGATLGARHPQLLELRSQLRSTQQALDAERQAYTGNAAAELASTQQLEQKLQAALREQHERVIQVRQLQDDSAKFQLELEAAQAVYKRALDGYDQVMFASSGRYSNIEFVSRARPPTRASKPRTGIVMLLAVVTGLGLGLGLPLLYELLNRRIRGRDDLERDHGIPVLAELGARIEPGLPMFPGAA